MEADRFSEAIRLFDAYNADDPNSVQDEGRSVPKELLYALRMTDRMSRYAPDASEHIQLAVRCQHIGRWEIPRSSYPEGKKGYLTWRNTLKKHHATIANRILKQCGYEMDTIHRVEQLIEKSELRTDPDTQLLEDVICLVFVDYYLDEFAARHEDDKVIDILRKTLRKMTPRGIDEVTQVVNSAGDRISHRTRKLILQASGQ